MKKLLFSLFIITLLFFTKPDLSLAQSGCAISLPTDTGQAIMTAEIQEPGLYRVWSRMKAADSTNNSFYVQIDNNCPVLVGNAPITADRWTWIDYQNGNTTQKIDVNLSVGEHIVKLIGNEDGVGVDKLLMTQDLKCVPVSASGDNCPAVVTPTPTTGAPDNTPPTISNIRAEEVTNTTVKLMWDLDEFATGQVEYGTSASYGTFTNKETSFNYDYHIQSLTNLTSGTTYYYKVISTDKAGNTTTSINCTFTTGASAIQNCNSQPPATVTTAPTTFQIVGKHVDENGNLFKTSNQKVTIINKSTNNQQTTTNSPSWSFDNLPRAEYQITADPIPGYTIEHMVCYECVDTDKFFSNNSFGLGETISEYVGITFKYTPAASLTSTPNATTLSLKSVKLHGIGLGGDNSNAEAQGNTNPQRKTRDIVIELFDANGKALPVIESKINYSEGSGVFTGNTTLSGSFSPGNYLVKIKSPQFLKKQAPGIINIVEGQENIIPTVSLTTGDLNNDNALTVLDYNILVDCYSDLLPAKDCEDQNKKASSDITDDGDVNAKDYNLFLRELSVASGD